jgi:REP-associated tyrosine transposase
VPKDLKHFQQSGQSHFVTFGCYRRRPLCISDTSKQTFESALERVRRTFSLCVYRYVITPDQVHLLLGEPQHRLLEDALKSLKQGVSRRLIGEADHLWEKRYYDLNIRTDSQFTEKLGYTHRIR